MTENSGKPIFLSMTTASTTRQASHKFPSIPAPTLASELTTTPISLTGFALYHIATVTAISTAGWDAFASMFIHGPNARSF
jgi:hypothetical protein